MTTLIERKRNGKNFHKQENRIGCGGGGDEGDKKQQEEESFPKLHQLEISELICQKKRRQ